jgi:hypothetical protein
VQEQTRILRHFSVSSMDDVHQQDKRVLSGQTLSEDASRVRDSQK